MARRGATPPAPRSAPGPQRPEPAEPPARGRPLPRLGVQQPDAALRPGARRAVRRSGARLRRRCAPPPIADDRPDLVVCSFFALGAMVAAEAAGMPFDVLFPNTYLLPAPGHAADRRRPAAGARARSAGCATGPSTGLTGRLWAKGLPRLNDLRVAHGLAPLASVLRPGPSAPAGSWCSPRPTSTSPPSCPPTSATSAPVLDDPAWAADAAGRRRRATTRSCWSRCRRRSRTTPTACSASSTPSARCRCVAW